MTKSSYNIGSGENAFQKYGAAALLLVLLTFNSIFTNNFFNISTLWNAVVQCTTVMLLSLGMMMVVGTGGIDLSVGAVVAFTSTVLVILLDAGLGAAAVIIAILSGGAIGVLSGTIVAKFKIQPLIVTLSLMTSVRGLAQIISNGVLIPLKDPTIQQLAYYRIGGVIPIQLVIIVGAVSIFYILAKKTRLGIYVESYGDNPQATWLAGIKTDKVILVIYMLLGLAAGIGGVIETARISATDPSNIGISIELDAIAATAIGGTSMSGGKVHVFGTVIGVFLMQIIAMMVNMNNIPFEASLLIKAAIIVFAVFIQGIKRRMSRNMVVTENE